MERASNPEEKKEKATNSQDANPEMFSTACFEHFLGMKSRPTFLCMKMLFCHITLPVY